MQKIKVEIVKPETHSFGNRMETAVTEIEYVNTDGDTTDWPGIFIRGDNALMYSMYLHNLLNMVEDGDDVMDVVAINACKGLADLLSKCRIG